MVSLVLEKTPQKLNCLIIDVQHTLPLSSCKTCFKTYMYCHIKTMNANSKKEDYGQFPMLNVSMTTTYIISLEERPY